MYTINITKAATTLDVDFDALTDSVKEYVIRYGMTQILNDAHSQIKAGEDGAADKAKSLAVKKLDALVAGEVRTARGESANPVEAEALRLARLIIVAGIKAGKLGKSKKVADYEPAAILGMTRKLFDVNKDKYIREAKASLAIKSGLIDGVDFEGLGL